MKERKKNKTKREENLSTSSNKKRKLNNNPKKELKLESNQPKYTGLSKCPISELLEVFYNTRNPKNLKINSSKVSQYLFNNQSFSGHQFNRMFNKIYEDAFLLLETLIAIYPKIRNEVENKIELTSPMGVGSKKQKIEALVDIAKANNLETHDLKNENRIYERSTYTLAVCPISIILETLYLTYGSVQKASQILFNKNWALRRSEFDNLFKNVDCKETTPFDLLISLAEIYPDIKKRVEKNKILTRSEIGTKEQIIEALKNIKEEHSLNSFSLNFYKNEKSIDAINQYNTEIELNDEFSQKEDSIIESQALTIPILQNNVRDNLNSWDGYNTNANGYSNLNNQLLMINYNSNQYPYVSPNLDLANLNFFNEANCSTTNTMPAFQQKVGHLIKNFQNPVFGTKKNLNNNEQVFRFNDNELTEFQFDL